VTVKPITARLELDNDDIVHAIASYLKSHGYNATGAIELQVDVEEADRPWETRKLKVKAIVYTEDNK
jgi:hypothetical protein